MKLLFFGDVVGHGGREAVKRALPDLKSQYNASFAIVNGENSAAGSGLTGNCVTEILSAADAVTCGDHTWDQKGFENEISRFRQVIRPANFASCQPGSGIGIFRNPVAGDIAVISLLGKVFMRESAYCPFETADKLLKTAIPPQVKTIVVDFHAEATSEKLAMARYLDGRVTAVIGTHTHVQTADARILAGGTAAITDVGMCGGDESILGREIPAVLKKFTTGMPMRLPVVEKGTMRLDGVCISYDYQSGRADKITAFTHRVEL